MYRRPPEGASASLLSVGWPLDLGAKQEVAELLQCGAFSIAGYRAAISVHSYMIILLNCVLRTPRPCATGIVKEKGKRRNHPFPRAVPLRPNPVLPDHHLT